MSTHKHEHGTGVMESWWEVRIMSGLPRMISERLFLGNPIKRILELLALEGDETVVDSGCGSGYYTLPPAKQLPTGLVEAVDIFATIGTSFSPVFLCTASPSCENLIAEYG